MAYSISGSSIIDDDNRLVAPVPNLKTLNNESLLGTGDISVGSGMQKLSTVNVTSSVSLVSLGSNLSSTGYDNFLINFMPRNDTVWPVSFIFLRVSGNTSGDGYGTFYTTYRNNTFGMYINRFASTSFIHAKVVGNKVNIISHSNQIDRGSVFGSLVIPAGGLSSFEIFAKKSETSSTSINIISGGKFVLYGLQ